MKFDFGEVEERMDDLVKLLLRSFSDSDRCFDFLKSKCKNMVEEEKLFYIFVTTHFDSPFTAQDFCQKLNWEELQRSDRNQIFEICNEFFVKKRFIEGHRRYFRCMKKEDKVQYTVEILQSYKDVMKDYGFQAKFFEVNTKRVEFDVLYERMKKIKHFHTRLPRFDHLERVSRTHDFYTVPKRFYAEDSTGPLDGLTYLSLGERYRKDKQGVKRYLTEVFPSKWNSADPQVSDRYKISPKAAFNMVIQKLEEWTIFNVKQRLPPEQRDNPAYLFDLESCLCNWQKGR